jgi:uncharacterized membrane protein
MNGTDRVRLTGYVTPVFILLLTVVGLFLRLYHLGARGYWFDEIVFAHATRLPTFDALITYVQTWNDHTPLSFFVIWLLRGLGGDEVSVRLPFALAGALAIPAVYLLGKTLINTRAGVLAAMLYTASPFALFVSQDAHPYAFLMLFTTLQVLFAYRAATIGHLRDWVGFGFFTLLNIYNDYLALAVLAVTLSFMGIVLFGRLLSPIIRRTRSGAPANDPRRPLTQVLAFAATLTAIFVLYLPWLSLTIAFLQMPVVSVYSTRTGGATFDDVTALAGNLGLNLLFVLLFLAGLLIAIVSLWRKRSLSGLLLLLWVCLSLVGLFVLMGDRLVLLQTRYFSFLLPAILILIALATDRIATSAQNVYERFSAAKSQGRTPPRYTSSAIYVALTLFVITPALPALTASYDWSKPVPQDFREAARIISATGPPSSIALSVGMWGLKPAPPFTIQGVDYYLWLYKSPIPYIDASLVDKHTADQLATTSATVWGVWALPWPMPPQNVQSANDMGLDVIPLENLALVRAHSPDMPTAQQLDTILAWGISVQPGLIATRSLLNPTYREATLGDNLLPPMSDSAIERSQTVLQPPNNQEQLNHWTLPANATFQQDGAFVLKAGGPAGETNVTLSTDRLIPGKTYVLSYRYNNVRLSGDQKVYLSTYTKEGRLIETFPYGSGFLCLPVSDSASAFAFTMPATATDVLLWLRITGEGEADFSDVEIRPIR